MTLPTANIIRTMRREKNVTQDELAQALGVSYQAVSRWENGQAYPDIELLPKIAAFFGITTDRLLGADAEARRKKKIEIFEAYREAYRSAENGFAKYEITAKAIREFPDSGRFTEQFMERALDQLINYNALPREEALPVVREYCRYLIENAAESVHRMLALHKIFFYENEENLNEWSRYVSEKVTIPQLLASRYDYLGEVEKCDLQHQRNLFANLNAAFDIEFRRRHPEHSTQAVDTEISRWHPENHLLPIADTYSAELILRLIDVLRDPGTDEDGWIFRRAYTYLDLAAARFNEGDNDGGYTALEESVRLYEIIQNLPIDHALPMNCPALNLLTVSALDYYCPRWNLLRNDPMQDKVQLSADLHNARIIRYETLYNRLTWTPTLGWFTSVRDDERYRAFIERIRKYRPEGFPE